MGKSDKSIATSPITGVIKLQRIILIPDIADNPLIIALIKDRPFTFLMGHLIIDMIIGVGHNLLIMPKKEGIFLLSVDSLHQRFRGGRSTVRWLHFDGIVHAKAVGRVQRTDASLFVVSAAGVRD